MLVKKNPQWTGQPHLANGFISGRNFHNIRRKLDKKRFNSDYSYKRMWTKQQQQTGKFKLTRQRASSARETVTISEENCIQKNYGLCKQEQRTLFYILIDYLFSAFDFCRFCVAIRFVHPRHNGQRPPTSKDFYPRFIHYIFSLSLFFKKSQYFPF